MAVELTFIPDKALFCLYKSIMPVQCACVFCPLHSRTVAAVAPKCPYYQRTRLQFWCCGSVEVACVRVYF